MNLFKKTYHGLSALTLILFLSSIVLPASLSAATLFCDMPVEAIASNTTDCCQSHYGTLASEDGNSLQTCSYQHLCSEAIASDQGDTPALTQSTKSIVVAVVFSYIVLDDASSRHHPLPPVASVHPPHNTPLFLLNSTFLN
ncbi:hypothetical protein [Fodinibius salsisoli]|uniref:Uncharacterized protein n=1 Tax=Fodinibius salsisoli TaxID=2820877 RepID=A0ABT3PKD1_9BACT|nr:hypothetical protein [Fodinibius salsisoli]MCW9706213.1 hypothetical protein [Fodinibius salsisoli]